MPVILSEAKDLGGGDPSPSARLRMTGEDAAIRHGLMHEALGAASASVQGVVNVHHMAGSAIARWGTKAPGSRASVAPSFVICVWMLYTS